MGFQPIAAYKNNCHEHCTLVKNEIKITTVETTVNSDVFVGF